MGQDNGSQADGAGNVRLNDGLGAWLFLPHFSRTEAVAMILAAFCLQDNRMGWFLLIIIFGVAITRLCAPDVA